MKNTLSTVVALASTLGVASAGWSDAQPFSCPSNTDNHCNSQQSTGFNWASLGLGQFGSYGGFDFDGWSCSSSFGGLSKRDVGFQDKCITGEASQDVSSCPSFGCGSSSDVSAFSVDTFQVSVEFDCNLEFHYSMPGGSICKQTSPCSKSGTTVKNTQCGGAKNVSIIYPSQPGGKSSCSIGIHSIGFDCHTLTSTPYSTPTPPAVTPPSSPTPPVVTPPSSPTPPAVSPPSSPTPPAVSPLSSPTPPAVSPPSSPTPPAVSPPSSPTPPAVSPPSSPTPPAVTPAAVTSPTTSFTTSTIFSTSTSTIISCGPEVTNCPAHSTVLATVVVAVSTTVCPVTATETPTSTPAASSSSSPAQTSSSAGSEETTLTEIVWTSTTVCPVTFTQVSNGITSTSVGTSTSTILIASSSTICTRCEHEASSTPAVVPTSSSSSSGAVSTAPCPPVLPSCLNTWLSTTGCSSNTDSDCYCPSSSFVSSVYACLSAYGASSSEIALAQKYFQGICAAHVSSNPAIVTAASTCSETGAVQTYPATTIQLESTTITVPQVAFSTVAGATTVVAALVPATSAASQAAGVPANPSTTFSSVGVSVGTVMAAPTSTSAVPFTGAASLHSVTFGTLGAAIVLALFAM